MSSENTTVSGEHNPKGKSSQITNSCAPSTHVLASPLNNITIYMCVQVQVNSQYLQTVFAVVYRCNCKVFLKNEIETNLCSLLF